MVTQLHKAGDSDTLRTCRFYNCVLFSIQIQSGLCANKPQDARIFLLTSQLSIYSPYLCAVSLSLS